MAKRIRLKVREIAEEKGMSITLISHKSYLALNTIRSIFQDPYRTVNTDTLTRLADALGVSVFDLMEEVEVPDDEEKT